MRTGDYVLKSGDILERKRIEKLHFIKEIQNYIYILVIYTTPSGKSLRKSRILCVLFRFVLFFRVDLFHDGYVSTLKERS